MRSGLEKNDYTENQNKILMCSFLAKLYNYKLITSEVIFSSLYMILIYHPDYNFGKREFTLDNALDKPSNVFRILMVVIILDNCGVYLTEGNKKEKLMEFIHFLQIYILTKVLFISNTSLENHSFRRGEQNYKLLRAVIPKFTYLQ